MTIVLGRRPGGSGGGGAPSGPAGGSLAGTYPDPSIAAGAIGAAEIAANAVGSSELADSAVDTNAIAANAVTQAKMASGLIVPAVLFDSTLGADAAGIDTGAAGIAAGYNVLEIWILARTAVVAVGSSVTVNLNNDSGANYDLTYVQNLNTTVTGVTSLAQTSWVLAVFGDSALANAATVLRITIPSYTQTTFLKQAECTASQVEDTAADARERVYSLQWRSTAAITRMAVAGNGGNLRAGSRLLIYGR